MVLLFWPFAPNSCFGLSSLGQKIISGTGTILGLDSSPLCPISITGLLLPDSIVVRIKAYEGDFKVLVK